MKSGGYIFGWRHGRSARRLYVWSEVRDGLHHWGVTESIPKARRFRTVEEAIQFWRTRHSFPQDYEHCIHDGYLHFFRITGHQVEAVLPL